PPCGRHHEDAQGPGRGRRRLAARGRALSEGVIDPLPPHSTPLMAKSKICELRSGPATARAAYSARSGRFRMNGTLASEMPPCVRRRWPRRPDRSWSFSDAPMQVSAVLMTATSPSRSNGRSNRRAVVARSHTASTLGIARRVLVLDVVGEREVEEVRPAPLQEPDSRLEHEQRELGRVDVGQLHADELEHVLDAVLLERRLVGAL